MARIFDIVHTSYHHVIFNRAVVRPIDSSRLLSVPRPESSQNLKKLITIDEQEALMVAKRLTARNRFIYTKNGAVLTSSVAMREAEENAAINRIKVF